MKIRALQEINTELFLLLIETRFHYLQLCRCMVTWLVDIKKLYELNSI
jgi:hypothetical protein